jgi:hypothetical protein
MANIPLLAHNVMPHHHHDEIPHFNWLPSPIEENRHDCSECCRHRDNKEICLFEQNIDAVNETKDDCPCSLCASSNTHFHGMLLQAVLLTFTCDFSSFRELKTLQEPPYLLFYHFDYASSGLGLRAPPTSI